MPEYERDIAGGSPDSHISISAFNLFSISSSLILSLFSTWIIDDPMSIHSGGLCRTLGPLRARRNLVNGLPCMIRKGFNSTQSKSQNPGEGNTHLGDRIVNDKASLGNLCVFS